MSRRTITRRTFLGFSGGALTLYGLNKFGVEEAIAAAIPGGTLLPSAIPKFVTPLVQPPAMHTVNPNVYSIAVRQFAQQILPVGLPATTVWSYGSTTPNGVFHYPAFTIEATRGTATTVTWINGLVDPSGNFLPHLLPVDPTLHVANPPGGVGGRDSRPTFTTTPGRYTGPVPIVTHVHGMERVEDWSDGYAEAWFLPADPNIPAEFAREGTWYNFFRTKASSAGVPPWGPGQAIFKYPNSQRPSTAWYHDHTLGMTRLNVYAGPAGFYLIRSNDPADNPTVAGTGGAAAVLPGPAASQGGPGPFYEIPVAIQDRSFNTNGSLFYPDTRAFFDGFVGPYIPDSDVSPIWNPEFFGNCIVANGKTWPFLDVEPRRYRFRLLNGCQSRFLLLRFDDPKVDVWQIGAEGGFLRAPVKVNDILMGPAERADIIVDFGTVKFGKTVILRNMGPDSPFAGGGFRPADPQSTGLVMQFRVNQTLASADTTTPPAALVMPNLPALPGGPARPLALLELESAALPIPIEARLGTFDTTVGLPGGIQFLKWEDPETETPAAGSSEVWELYNFTADAHPIHVHEVLFEVVNRQRLDKQTGLPIQAPVPPGPTEDGRKDTVIAYPGEVTRVRITFGPGGQYVWHCHIVEHEDNEMMRPYRIGGPQDGQPA
ncbi:MAG: bilirubin oxidase [Myxococcaceae bacterium]|nr:MAG: bilirubin oxidase [Myxococcaceae bacterium]